MFKLWLHDYIIDNDEARISEKDARMVCHIIQEAFANIATPVGKTNNIHLEDIVKQRTIFGPKRCCATTDKVNIIDKTSFYMINELEMKNFVHVDDISGSGKSSVFKLAKNLKNMKEEKKFTFNIEKTT